SVLADPRPARRHGIGAADRPPGAESHRLLLLVPHRRSLSVAARRAPGTRRRHVDADAEPRADDAARGGRRSAGEPRDGRPRSGDDPAARAPRQLLPTRGHTVAFSFLLPPSTFP